MMEKTYPPMKRLKKVTVSFINLTIFKTVSVPIIMFALGQRLTLFIHGNYHWKIFA